jgi:hypothetical protein
MSDTQTKDRLRDLERRLTAAEIQAARTPVRLGKVGAPNTGNVIYAQVVGAVGTGTPTFTFDNAVAVVGSVPTDGTGTAQNQYAQEYVDNEWVLLFQEKSSGQWLTERGGTSGSQVVYFELTENKSYGDASKLAKPVLADGTMDSGADAFHVVDDTNQFYGRAAESGADGYRGFGLRFTDDYSEGVPGFRIITMEGPAQFLIVTLDENLASPTDCSYAEDPAVFGLAFRGRTPAPVESVDVQVYDDLGAASGAESGEKLIVTWNEDDERYCFWQKLVPKKYYIRVRGDTTATVSANTTSFDVDTVELLQGDMPALTGGELTIQNAAKIPLANGATAEFRWNEDDEQWETEPLVCHQVLGKATAAVSGGSFTIDNIELVCGSDPRSDPSSSSETLSISNPFAWNIDDNGDVLAVKKANGTWIATQADCPA